MPLTLAEIQAQQSPKKAVSLAEIKASVTPAPQPEQKPSLTGTLLKPATEGLKGLAETYGGGENGIAPKIVQDVKAGAVDIQRGMQKGGLSGVPDALKGIVKAGARVAGDVVGAVYAPVGAAIGATGIGALFNKVAETKPSEGSVVDRVTDIPAVQNFVAKRPNLEEDFTRALNLFFATKETGKIDPKTVIPRTGEQIKVGVDATTKVLGKLAPAKVQEAVGNYAESTLVKNVDDLLKSNKSITRRSVEAESRGVPLKETLADPEVYRGLKVEKGKINATEASDIIDARIEKVLEAKRAMLPKIDTIVPEVPRSVLRENAIKSIQGKFTPADETSMISAIDAQINALPSTLKPSDIDLFRARARESARNAKGIQKSSSEYSALENGARKTIFDITDDLPISGSADYKALNNYVKNMIVTKEFIDTVINGQTVKGGRLGTLFGRTIGAIALSGQGPLGTLAGSEIGGLISNILTNNTLGSSAKMSLIRNITNEPAIIAKAQKLLGEVQDLNVPLLGPKTSEFHTEITGGKPIQLGPRAPSTIDAQERSNPNISRQNTANTMTTTVPKNAIDPSLQPIVGGVKPTITVGGKTIDLDFMHSAEGTKFFKTLSPADQVRLSQWDSAQSRALIGKEPPKTEGGIPTTILPKAKPDVAMVYKTAPQAKTHIDTLADTIASANGAVVAKTGLKSVKRVQEKADTDYGGDISKVKDIARNTIIPKASNLASVIAALKNNEDFVSLKVQTPSDYYGYQGYVVNVKTPSGLISEIQVNTAEMIYAKELPSVAKSILGEDVFNKLREQTGLEAGLGHKYYEVIRSPNSSQKDIDEAIKKSKEYYDAIRGLTADNGVLQ